MRRRSESFPHSGQVADPLLPTPLSDSQIYPVRLNRLGCAIMLGILTYDANLLVVTPKKG